MSESSLTGDMSAAKKGKQVLATDLDGTLIPLGGDDRNRADLQTLARELRDHGVELVFVTGRHFASVLQAIEELQLPVPDWILCDVGTSILQRGVGSQFRPIDAYQQHLHQVVSAMPVSTLRRRLEPIQELRLQEPEKQGPFKLSYYADAAQLDSLQCAIQLQLDSNDAPYSIIHSVDPFNGDGLIDLVPADTSKAYALRWWSAHTGQPADSIVFAGDSGNDLAALTAGYRAIVVANADHRTVEHAFGQHRQSNWRNRLFIASGNATSGVLEGCRWFGLIGHESPPVTALGATPLTHDRTHFRVWAPHVRELSVEICAGEPLPRRHALDRDQHGFFSGDVPETPPHTRYLYRLDGKVSRPDPASRYQPDGVHGASEIIPPAAFPWTDAVWQGVPKRDLIIYELHIGAFTQEGTFRAAISRLAELVELGVTAIEIMPVAQSPGRWNWGYDGVDLFAVRNTYGRPEDFKALVDACHQHGLAVILDVVYNHVGPEGNYLACFGPYFSEHHRTPWGEAFNFDGAHAEHVRHFIIENAIRWIDEYHLDGLRLDAVHSMHDDRKPGILAEIRAAVADYSRTERRNICLIAEANVYDPELLGAQGGESAYDATWCDCLMHSVYAHALPELQLSNRVYRGADDLAETLQHGFLYFFGGRDVVRVGAKQRRDLCRDSTDSPLASFVTALQTHDSVGNHPQGKRLHHLTGKAFQRAAAALTLLYPSIPLVWMGEESASNAPFPFFADFEDPELRQAVDAGRANEYPQHVWDDAVSPSDPRAFWSAKCDRAEDQDAEMFAWYQALIGLRKQGLADGWLCPACLTTQHDASIDLFTLCFTAGDGRGAKVLTRLASVDNQNTRPAAASVVGDILLSSEPIRRAPDGCLWLQPNHAVIAKFSG